MWVARATRGSAKSRDFERILSNETYENVEFPVAKKFPIFSSAVEDSKKLIVWSHSSINYLQYVTDEKSWIIRINKILLYKLFTFQQIK